MPSREELERLIREQQEQARLTYQLSLQTRTELADLKTLTQQTKKALERSHQVLASTPDPG